MYTDISGYPLTISNDAARVAWDKTVEGVLSHGAATPAHLDATLSADPHFAMGHAVKGILLLSLARRELLGVVQQALENALAAAALRPITTRENAFIEALRYWSQGAPRKAAACLDASLMSHLRDALAIKLAQVIRFMIGDQEGMLASAQACAPGFDETHPLFGYVLGCYAFAMEESHHYGPAELIGRHAMESAPRDVWGRHAVAHVLEMTGRPEEGAAWLQDSSSWAHANNLRFHIVWHLALFMLERGDTPEALRIYDDAVRADKTDDFRDIANAASLLAQLEFRGVDVGARWEELADCGERRLRDGQLVFADLHYVMALLGAGRMDGAEAIGRALVEDSRSHASPERRDAAREGALVAYGLLAYREGNYFEATRLFERARDGLTCIGGSNAQRDVFEQAYIESLIKSDAHDRAGAVLRERIARRGGRNLYASQRLARVSRNRSGVLVGLVQDPYAVTAHPLAAKR